MTGGLRVVQLGLSTSDLPGSARLYAELFGFRNAGGMLIWGEPVRVQGLVPAARGMVWWLVGAQPFFQLELFHFTAPVPRPVPGDWRPSDHGWSTFGVGVPRLDDVAAVLDRWGIAHRVADDARRLTFRDPFVGCLIDVIAHEDLAGASGAAVLYAISSVADLAAARAFYGEVVGLPTGPLAPAGGDDATSNGMSGAGRDGFVVDGGALRLEIVAFADPPGRPKPADHCTADQGIVNIALGTRDVAAAEAAVARLVAAGCTLSPVLRIGAALGTYVLDAGREIEVIALPATLDGPFGFAPAAPFLGQPA